MAASARAITPTHTGPFTTPNRPSTPGAIANAAAHARNANSGATFGAHLTKSPRGLSPRQSPQPALDERRHRELEERKPSPNPAIAAVQSLVGARSKDGSPAPPQMSATLEKVAKAIVIPEQVTSDNMQTSPVSLSSFGSADSTTAPTATAHEATAGPTAFQFGKELAPHPPQHHHHQPIAPNPNDPGNRAFTFPGPLPTPEDIRAPTRQLSLPGYNGPKSPSAKRHKCPYCSTDFTRHHNLKSHLLTHSQEKPYTCSTCQARFRRLHDLKRHSKLHTGERPHTCPKCGRRFARGDALARHNKGQGGCAGRRASFSIDDELADGKTEDMDGVVYHEADGEGDDDEDGSGRRVSEPARKRQNTGSSTQGSYHQHSSTYPPIMANRAPIAHNNLRPLYPPASGQQAAISPKLAPSSISSLHFGAASQQPNVYSQGMTESPKPLSPGHHEHRLGVPETGGFPPRSPNMSLQVHHQNLSRGRSSSEQQGSNLAPPQSGNQGPLLPSLPGLDALNKRNSQGGSKNGHGIHQQQQSHAHPNSTPNPGSSSQPGSLSSHGSVGSMREVLGQQGQGQGQPGVDVWQYVREMEARLANLQKDHEMQLGVLQGELSVLRRQVGQATQGQQQQQQGQGQSQGQQSQQSQTQTKGQQEH